MSSPEPGRVTVENDIVFGSGGGRDLRCDVYTPPGAPKDAPGVLASCRGISEIQSYRYTISLELQSPAFQRPNEGIASDPLGTFAEALTALFADMRFEGAYVAPDRSQATLRFQDEEVEMRTIGDRSWVQVGSTWQEQRSSPEGGTLLTPQTVCEEILEELAPSLRGVKSQPETVNGVETEHYRLDEADLRKLPDILGIKADSTLPEHFLVELWLARNGRWPMRLQITASDTSEEGQPAKMKLFMEFRDINDQTIRIEPPPASSMGT